MHTNHNRIKVSDLETDDPDKILVTNSKGELEFIPTKNIKVDSYNALDYDQEGKALDARQGKILKDLIDNFNQSNHQQPYLDELIPNIYSPNTTNNIIIKGSFFTPETVVAIQGQIINSFKFKSDNEIHVNITTGQTDGTFNVTINNGISKTFADVFSVLLGTVYDSVESDWIDKVNINVKEKGTALCISDTVRASGKWTRLIDVSKNFSIRFHMPFSPLSKGGIDSFVTIKDKNTNETKFYIEDYGRMEGDDPNRVYFGINGQQVGYLQIDRSKYLELRKVGNIVNAYVNDGKVLIATVSNTATFPNNLQLAVSLLNSDVRNLKYIELIS
ncbi:hypothetical protein L0669_22015 [Flavobacterium bizetiae]|uniref:hypothetical protein n=1 Tax=Flavobacterium bizetiae TaxID=2704140 RepID=UPI0021E76C9C|nr:hypothetical protein [Flavobacterium bizetiae]UTN03987.1 hypothetical protein L0669_22015 [Flavobacterium bizetiae]